MAIRKIPADFLTWTQDVTITDPGCFARGSVYASDLDANGYGATITPCGKSAFIVAGKQEDVMFSLAKTLKDRDGDVIADVYKGITKRGQWVSVHVIND